MKRITNVLVALLAAVSIAAVGGAADAPAAPPATKEALAWKTFTMVEETATVKAIDLASRMVTLEGPKGKKITFKAGEEVRNLAQVRVGDAVKFSYYESLAVRVLQEGEAPPVAGETTATSRARFGEKPAGVAGSEKTVLATVTAVDQKAKTVTLKGDDGKTVTVTPKDPENLAKVKVGDRLVITYSEAVAVSVEEAK